MFTKLLCIVLLALGVACSRAPKPAQQTAAPAAQPAPATTPSPAPPPPATQAEAPPAVDATVPVASAPRPSPFRPVKRDRPQPQVAAAGPGHASPPPAATPAPAPVAATRHRVTIPVGTTVRVRLAESIDTRHNNPGDRFHATLDAPVMLHGRVVVPKGTPFEGRIVESKRSGRLRGRTVVGLELDSFYLRGKRYRIDTGETHRASSAHKKRNLLLIGGGGGLGASIGAVAAGGVGALVGAGAGAAAGTTAAFITGKRNLRMDVETPVDFSLRAPVRVRD